MATVKIIENEAGRYRIETDALDNIVELDKWVEPKWTTRGQSAAHWRSIKGARARAEAKRWLISN